MATKKPWEWKPVVRSRAQEWLCFAGAGCFVLLFLVTLGLDPSEALRVFPGMTIMAGSLIALGLLNRKRRLREIAGQRLLP